MSFTMIHLRAKNTTNGNPRRLYLRIDAGGCIIRAWDEGYSGHNAVPEGYRDAAHRAVSIETTPKEYRRILKEYGK